MTTHAIPFTNPATIAVPAGYKFKVKDKISALTHFIGFIGAILGMPVMLLIGSAHHADTLSMISLAVFMLSMICLYGASTSYHTFDISTKANKVLKKLDHSMIFVLIAGSYTPVCLIALRSSVGPLMLAIVWSIAVIGIIFKMCWVTCPKWISSVIYIGMGWVCLMGFKEILIALPAVSFAWLLAGGIAYTVGGVIYALKQSFLRYFTEEFGAHEVFHIFVMIGSACHFLAVATMLIK